MEFPMTEGVGPIALVVYDYGDRRNGWYVQKLDAAGNQIGEAVYHYRKGDAVAEAKEWAKEYGVTFYRYKREGSL